MIGIHSQNKFIMEDEFVEGGQLLSCRQWPRPPPCHFSNSLTVLGELGTEVVAIYTLGALLPGG